MILNGRQIGVEVEGTQLLYHGRAPRRSASDRNRMAWYECQCGEFFSCRVNDVKTGKTVSCSCVGKKAFTDHYQQRAGNLPAAVKDEIFRLTHTVRRRVRECYFTGRRVRRTEKTTREDLARKFHMDRLVIDFVIAARCQFIRAAAKLGRRGWKLLTKVERTWYRYQEWTYRIKQERESARLRFEALPLSIKMAKLEEARRRRSLPAGPPIDLQALLLDPNAEIDLGDEPEDWVVTDILTANDRMMAKSR